MVAARPHIQKQLETAAVAQCIKEYAVPTTLQTTNSLSGPITYNYQNTDWHPKTTYIPGGFRTNFGNTYVQVQMVQPEEPIVIEGFELEHAYLNTCLKNIPGFETELDNVIAQCLDTLISTHAKIHHQKVEARLQCINLHLPGLYGICLQNLITELLPYYFNADGSLRMIENCDDFETKLNEYFLKPLKETKQYNIRITKCLQAISSTHIKESSFLSNVANMFLQSLWYSNPSTWKQKISSNEYNQKLLKFIYACKNNDWHTAQQYRHSSPDAEKMYDFYFNEYASKTYNAFGIYLALEQDPLWQNMPIHEKEALLQNREKQEELNHELLLRHDWKMKLQQAWDIPDDAHLAVHKALYELTGISSTAQLVDAIFKLMVPENPQRHLLIETFFNKQGILKDLENAHTNQFGTGSQLLNPELHILCHQFNQLIYAFNAEIDSQRKVAIQEALQTIATLIKENSLSPHKLAAQSTYLAIVTQQTTEIIKEQLKGFSPPTVLGCVVEDKNKLPEISTCPPQEEEQPSYGCGLEMPMPDTEDGIHHCLPDMLESEIVRCPGIIGVDIEDTVTSCSWSRGLPVIEVGVDKDSDKKEEVDEQVADDKEDGKESDGTPQQQEPKTNKRKNQKPWELRKKNPAINLEKVDFSDLSHLTGEEIELIKKSIELFLEIDGFLVHDGALWRILKHGDQKKGSLFELEYAIKLNDQEVQIVKLNYEIKILNKAKEIDIITDTELIECKAITWHSITQAERIKRLQDQLRLGKLVENTLQKPYVVVSKYPISSNWKKWLDENDIKYREENL